MSFNKKDIEFIEKKRKRGRPTGDTAIDKVKILKIALKAFAEKGFNGVTISAVSKLAQVDDSLIHYHFGNKESLWQKAIQQASEEFQKESKETLSLFKDLESKALVKVLVRQYIYYHAHNPELNQVIMHELTLKSDRSNWLIDEVLKPLSVKIDRIKKSGILREDFEASHLTSIFYGLYNTFFLLNLQMERQFDVDVFSQEEIEKHADIVIGVIERSLFK